MDLGFVAVNGVCLMVGLIAGYAVGTIGARFRSLVRTRDTYPVQRDTYPDDLTKRA